MSFSDLVTGGAACGPSNPLQQLGKRFGQDRSSQMDRFGADAGEAGAESSMRPSFRGQHGGNGPLSASEQAFFQHAQAPPAHAFDLQPLKGALPSMGSGSATPEMHAAWQLRQHHPVQMHSSAQREHFERNFRHSTPPSAESQWARDYSPSATTANGSPAVAHAHAQQPNTQQYMNNRPMGYGHAPMHFIQGHSHMNMMHRPAPSSVMGQGPTMQQAGLRSDQEQGSKITTIDGTQWDTAFSAMEETHKGGAPLHRTLPAYDVVKSQQNVSEQTKATPSQDADELARTAGRLVSTVEHETNNKFKQSNFLNLMRKIRDRQAEIQGTDIIDTHDAEQSMGGASHASEKGKGRAMDVGSAPANQIEATSQASAAARNPILATRIVGSTAEELTGRQELNDMWADEDARTEEREQEAHMRRMAFVGDGGNVGLRQQEDEAEFNKYQGLLGAHLGPAAAGLRRATNAGTSSMEEDFDELQGADFVGRRWEGTRGRGVPGLQTAEWDVLQKDWDAWQASSAGLEQVREPPLSAAAAPSYRFHAYNPYVGASTPTTAAHNVAAALPADMQSVLEREAAVQREPNDASSWLELGVKQQENEREGLAIAALHRAIQLDPTLRDAWLALAVSYTNESDRAAALEAVERWIDATPAYRAVAHQFRQANEESTSAASQTPLQRHEQLTKLLINLARHSATQESGIDADIQMALGVLFNASEDYDKAIDCFTTVLHVRPDDWLTYNRLGATLSNSGRSAEALRHYQQALDLKPGFVRCHFNMSISCLNLQMYREAASHIYTALTLQSESVDNSPGQAAGGSGGGVTSGSLWETLRVACELMDRPDLASLTAQRDLDRFDPADFWIGGADDGESSSMEPTM